eukprot:g20530.t1
MDYGSSGVLHEGIYSRNMKPRWDRRPCNDCFFVILFLIALLGTTSIAGKYGSEVNFHSKLDLPQNLLENEEPDFSPTEQKYVFHILMGAILIGLGGGVMYLEVVKRCAPSIIYLGFWLNMAMLTFLCIASFIFGQIFAGVIWLLLLFLLAMYIYFVRDRIKFTSTILFAAAASLQQHLGTIVLAIFMCLLQCAFTLYIMFCIFAVYNALQGDESQQGLMSGLLVYLGFVLYHFY